jgi:hypothetical protein
MSAPGLVRGPVRKPQLGADGIADYLRLPSAPPALGSVQKLARLVAADYPPPT